MIPSRLAVSVILVAGALTSHQPLQAQSQGGGSDNFAAYSIEWVPTFGLDLPFDLWGTPGTLNVVGFRTTYSYSSTNGIELGTFYQHKGIDRAYTFDISYRKEISFEGLHAFFNIGTHYSYYDLTYEDGIDDPANGLTDSGSHNGIVIGTGLQMPVTPMMPLRFGMRYYNGPQLWLMLEVGLGFRW